MWNQQQVHPQCVPQQCQPTYNAQQQQQSYPYAWPPQGYEVAPGGPVTAADPYHQQYTQQLPYCPDPAAYSTVPYDPNVAKTQTQTQAYGSYYDQQMPALPPGAKLVAEYFVGYLDEHQPVSNNSHSSGQVYQPQQPAAYGYNNGQQCIPLPYCYQQPEYQPPKQPSYPSTPVNPQPTNPHPTNPHPTNPQPNLPPPPHPENVKYYSSSQR